MKNTSPFGAIFVPNIQNNVIMNWKFLNQPLGDCDLSGGYAPAKKRIIPLVIMAAAAAGSAIYSGAKSASANRKAQQQLNAERVQTEAERRRKMNEDYLDTQAGQNLIRQANEQADKIWKRERGAAVVTGATERSAMAKQYGNDLVGNAIANIAANDTARKDNIDQRYEEREHQLRQQQMALDQQKAIDQANAGSQLISSIGNLAGAYAATRMGVGSPGGSGVTSTPQQSATNQLQNMAGGSQNLYNITPEMQMQWAMQNYGTLFGQPIKYHPAER